jgi:hypothetical protein
MPYEPLSTDCKLGNQNISVSEALDLGIAQRRKCACIECGKRVVPHRGSHDGSQQAHFEHHRRNTSCSRSDHRMD